MGKRRRLFNALSIACAVLVASPSWAAVVEPGVGDLTINQGQGFKTVTGPSNANVGDMIMVGPGGNATIVYEDGCKVNVKPGAVASIAPLSPCASGSKAQNDDWGWWVGGILLAVGIGIAAWRASESNGTTTPVQCLSNC
jgi:hypothetical protein